MRVRTRYAPSPTGYLHVGGLRTALYNYLFARQNGGDFVLRIEDTDQSRRVEGAVENLLQAFAWLGLDFDEGPFVGGPHAPYVQSQRLDVYREHLARLAVNGHAYPCFCSAESLEAMRSEQTRNREVPMYDRRCRRIAPDEAERRVRGEQPHVWRLAVPEDRAVAVHDLIRGEVRFDASTLDDPVLMKSDGFPTYHLANVVDDHLMEISHVIRGEEWLPSTPKHVLLYESFGWECPCFAHLPLLLNPDRSKMSKRSSDVAVEEYRRRGILPAALINFVALLGWHPSDEAEIFNLTDLIGRFSLERVGKAGAIFDLIKLRWMNAEYIKAESDDSLFEHVRPLLTDLTATNGESRVRYAVRTLRGGAESYADLAARVHDVYAPRPPNDPEMAGLLTHESTRVVIRELGERLGIVEPAVWRDFERLETLFKQLAVEAGQTRNLKGKALWRSLRAALTGQPHGPELAKLVGIWGRERVLTELQRSLSNTHQTAVHHS